jgi:membrane-bound serine protease (ClpP class)
VVVGRLTPFLDDLVLGALLLVAVALLAPGALPWSLLGVVVWFALKLWLFRAHLRRPAVGVEAMVGRVGTASSALTPRGHVHLDGELWEAEALEPVAPGERVRVLAVEGLTLRVAPLGVAGAPAWEAPRGSLLLGLARRFRR